MKAIPIKNGIIHLAEVKPSKCPHCTRDIPFEEIEDKWMKQNNHTMNIKCKCKRTIGVTQSIVGDFVVFEL